MGAGAHLHSADPVAGCSRACAAGCAAPGASSGRRRHVPAHAPPLTTTVTPHTPLRRLYSSAIELDSKSAMIYTKRAAAYINMRQNSQALRDLNTALEADPKSVQVGALARWLAQAGPGWLDGQGWLDGPGWPAQAGSGGPGMPREPASCCTEMQQGARLPTSRQPNRPRAGAAQQGQAVPQDLQGG